MDGDFDDGLVDRAGHFIPPERRVRPAQCRCGARRYASQEAASEMERSGVDKCPTCHTFATDHEWRGTWGDPSDNESPRCIDCDIRYGSHR